MDTAPVTPTPGGSGGDRSPPGAGHTSGATAVSPGHAHPRHRLGNALRAVRVYAEAAFDVAVLGDTSEKPAPERRER
ncbi:hypothetical protein [Streptomyces sp. JJ66]|uniref:hypothetical protein n=1 Tax=Streptomyces sp. JJ66 TaxID=2803843 RepID=UPI00214C757B|nr:hypothetical protein [Streptomyces sp. JJ66]